MCVLVNSSSCPPCSWVLRQVSRPGGKERVAVFILKARGRKCTCFFGFLRLQHVPKKHASMAFYREMELISMQKERRRCSRSRSLSTRDAWKENHGDASNFIIDQIHASSAWLIRLAQSSKARAAHGECWARKEQLDGKCSHSRLEVAECQKTYSSELNPAEDKNYNSSLRQQDHKQQTTRRSNSRQGNNWSVTKAVQRRCGRWSRWNACVCGGQQKVTVTSGCV